MIYIYDILLNFSSEKLYDFFEWEKTDKLDHIKKIPMFKVERDQIHKFLYKKVKIKDNFVNKIYNLTEVYTPKKVIRIPYAFLITDGFSALAVKTDKFGNVKYKSKLIIDEEEEILCLSNKLGKTELNIEEDRKITTESFLTRNEEKIKSFLIKSIENAYKEKDYEKLKYLYSEYSNKQIKEVDSMYDELLSSVNKSIQPSHYNLYNLLQLATNKN